MHENVGNTDRWLRVAVGGALVLGAVSSLGARRAFGPGLLLATGALLIETALTRVCPMSAALGVDSRDWEPFARLGASSEKGDADGRNDADDSGRRELGRVREAPGGTEALRSAQPEVAT
ncbi:MAG TPA: DUF2892 domain-containing protein [Polyangiaceae bacterium]|nr:DUF2892 domain-containing protein [Polyangiaceae bacterium]